MRFAELRAAALQPNIASYDAVLLALDESARFEEAQLLADKSSNRLCKPASAHMRQPKNLL